MTIKNSGYFLVTVYNPIILQKIYCFPVGDFIRRSLTL